jgi:hypothetical protein
MKYLGLHLPNPFSIKMRGNLDLPKSGALNAGLNLAERLHDGRHNLLKANLLLVPQVQFAPHNDHRSLQLRHHKSNNTDHNGHAGKTISRKRLKPTPQTPRDNVQGGRLPGVAGARGARTN